MNEDIKNYLDLNNNTKPYSNIELTTFEANPNEQDYFFQYIFRYFVRKRNDTNGLIYEISKQTYDLFKISKLYIGVEIKWKIYGDRNETEQLNKNSVAYGKKTISNLDTYMTDYLKFWKG
jgi:hypothetical protein